MAGDLTSHPPEWTAAADYLEAIESRLARWPRARRRVLRELADGLSDAVQHYQDRGVATTQSVARALHDSGPAATVAAEIADLLAAATARRTALTLLLTGPLVGTLWLWFLAPGQPPAALLLTQPAITAFVMASAACAALTILATRTRRHPGRWTPARIAAASCAAAGGGDILLLFLAFPLLAASAHLGLIGAAAVAASLTRLTLTQRVALRDLPASP